MGAPDRGAHWVQTRVVFEAGVPHQYSVLELEGGNPVAEGVYGAGSGGVNGCAEFLQGSP